MRPDLVAMVPPSVPNPEFMVTFTGICEILGAVGLLLPRTRRIMVAGIVVTHVLRGTLSPQVGDVWYGLRGAIRATAVSTFIGVGSAAVFWLVAGRRVGAGE